MFLSGPPKHAGCESVRRRVPLCAFPLPSRTQSRCGSWVRIERPSRRRTRGPAQVAQPENAFGRLGVGPKRGAEDARSENTSHAAERPQSWVPPLRAVGLLRVRCRSSREGRGTAARPCTSLTRRARSARECRRPRGRRGGSRTPAVTRTGPGTPKRKSRTRLRRARRRCSGSRAARRAGHRPVRRASTRPQAPDRGPPLVDARTDRGRLNVAAVGSS